MLSIFKRYRMRHAHKQPVHPFTFMTVCERVKPMSQAAFEFAQQSLELASYWLYPQSTSAVYSDAGHFVVTNDNPASYQHCLSQHLGMHSMPVVLSNCHETLLHAIPIIALQKNEIGLINIGHRFDLKQTLDVQVGSAFHFALNQYDNTRLFCLGVDEESQNSQLYEYAEDLGVNWLSSEDYSFRNRTPIKSELTNYIARCDDLIITVDLAALMPSAGFNDNNRLSSKIILRTLRQCVLSGKVKMIQLVGAKDNLICSRQTKEILDALCELPPILTHAA
ncbi:arginase [Photobacterium jeanii]|uniref:Arginase n=1 Tax=Photobacterium jeanii TaxID=858640 RepID=A0A178KN87_9GAMM|nr:arginase family protein [Photobacterium jeanii]OAN18022.1 arginase [Photobacterium jeanii]PST92309.1 arginase [Photobacterium jeanii]